MKSIKKFLLCSCWHERRPFVRLDRISLFPRRTGLPMREAMHDIFPCLARKLDRFDRMLCESSSATATLMQWIGPSADGSAAALHAHAMPNCPPSPLTAGQLARLAVPASDIAYRRVRLVHKGRILSDAQNWYVPSRLTPDMVRALDTSTTPFGTVVEPLRPTRETLASKRLWSPDDPSERLPPRLLQHHALVRSGDGTPICEVSEVYTRNILHLLIPSAAR